MTLCLVTGPVSSRSGYGDLSRDFVRSLIKAYPEWEIKILDRNWGSTPRTELHTKRWEFLQKYCLTMPNMERQPDVHFHISIPAEFQPIAKHFNVGYTAGIETTACDISWIHGSNKMNLVLATSNHSVNVLKQTQFTEQNHQTQQTRVHKITKPVDLLHGAVDNDVYFKTTKIPNSVNDLLNGIPEKFCFLFVGHWLKGRTGHDRKDVGTLARIFYEAFKDKPNTPALILKTSSADFSIIDREEMLNKIRGQKKHVKAKRYPNIYLLHGNLAEEEMNGLYNHSKIKAFVTFTKGEGFGLPLLQVAKSEIPVIAPAWSAQADYLTAQNSVVLAGRIQNVHASAAWEHVILKESKWFYVDEQYATNIMKDVYRNYERYRPKGRMLANVVNEKFTIEQMIKNLKQVMDKYCPIIPKESEISLPQLKKVERPQEMKLPMLKKITRENINGSKSEGSV